MDPIYCKIVTEEISIFTERNLFFFHKKKKWFFYPDIHVELKNGRVLFYVCVFNTHPFSMYAWIISIEWILQVHVQIIKCIRFVTSLDWKYHLCIFTFFILFLRTNVLLWFHVRGLILLPLSGLLSWCKVIWIILSNDRYTERGLGGIVLASPHRSYRTIRILDLRLENESVEYFYMVDHKKHDLVK